MVGVRSHDPPCVLWVTLCKRERRVSVRIRRVRAQTCAVYVVAVHLRALPILRNLPWA